jgi:RNA polymerase sigma-70 factor (ECF subfamily)
VSKLRTIQTEQNRQQRYAEYVDQLKIGEELFGAQHVQLREKEDQEARIRSILGELPEKQRICVEYFYFGNKTYKEIADLLNEKVGKVRSHIQNGRRNLKLMLIKG